MTKVINLRQVRKQRARTEARATADANAAKHGMSKAERESIRQVKELAERRLDGHQRDPGADQPE